MATTKIIFNVSSTVKESAMRRAKREGTTLTSILNSTLSAYGKEMLSFDPRFDLLSNVDLEKILQSEKDIKTGRVHTLSKTRAKLKL